MTRLTLGAKPVGLEDENSAAFAKWDVDGFREANAKAPRPLPVHETKLRLEMGFCSQE